MMLVLELILLIVVANVIILDKTLSVYSAKELKRRARSGSDSRAAAVFKMTAFGNTLPALLFIKGALAAAILVILLSKSSWVLVTIFILLIAYAVFVWRPLPTQNGWMWAWASTVAPLIGKVLGYLQPALIKLTNLIPKNVAENRSGVYEKEDLLEFLNHQNARSENRISETDLKMAFNALTFGDKDVGSVMTPLRKVKLVAMDEVVGPLLMDELHSSGFSRFPVVEELKYEGNPKITGTLYLKSLVGHTGKARVADLMESSVFFVNETQSLESSLSAFIKTHHHLFIVVNNFEEMVGVISIEDILEQIVGSEIIDEFDKYEDLRAVAAKEAKKDHQEHISSHKVEPEAEAQDKDLS